MILHLSLTKNLFKAVRRRVSFFQVNFQVNNAEHVIITRGNWGAAGDDDRSILWSWHHMDMFNAHKCPNLRALTVVGLTRYTRSVSYVCAVSLLPTSHLRSTLVFLFIERPPYGSCQFLSPVKVHASIDKQTFRCPFTGRQRVKMEDFWKAVESSAKPLDAEQVSFVLRKLPADGHGWMNFLKEVCVA